MNKRICILTDSLGSGGAEKMAANMSISLTKEGYEVCVVSMLNIINYEFAGNLYNFGLVKEQKTKLTAFKKFRHFFNKQKFDVIIDHRMRPKFLKELLLSRFVFKNCHVIYCVHHYDLSYYFTFPNNSFLSKHVLVKNRTFVSVSNEIKKSIKSSLSLDSILIYNYVQSAEFKDLERIDKADGNNYVISIGRLVKVKQFDVLIKSYKNSQLIENGIDLLILGEGDERNYLEALINDMNLKKHVKLLGFRNQPFRWVKKAKALILASRHEGFPMVLIEALALEIPIISFDCKSGPSEIIQGGRNGILVPMQNGVMLTEAMDKLLLDNEFYQKIKSNLKKDTFSYAEEKIISKWVKLIEGIG